MTAPTYADTSALSGFNLLPRRSVAQSYVYRVTSINSDLIESAPSNEVTDQGCRAANRGRYGGNMRCAGWKQSDCDYSPVTATTNGQVQYTFSEPLDVIFGRDSCQLHGREYQRSQADVTHDSRAGFLRTYHVREYEYGDARSGNPGCGRQCAGRELGSTYADLLAVNIK